VAGHHWPPTGDGHDVTATCQAVPEVWFYRRFLIKKILSEVQYSTSVMADGSLVQSLENKLMLHLHRLV